MTKAIYSSLSDVDTSLVPSARPNVWSLFLVWSRIGLQSFGGGSATILLIRREFIERYKWLTEEEYSLYWSLCQLSPGIILVAMTILIGRKLRGWSGILISLAGLLLPSSIVTCLFSAGFELIQMLSPVQAMLRGLLPATAGLMLTISLQFALPSLKQAWKSGQQVLRLAECMVIISGSVLAVTYWHVEIINVVLGAIVISLGIFYPWQRRLEGLGTRGEA
ncbi:chromate transporter [Tengunoibacter tsumagoiensis]|uniref:Chromate transporter n=1 Tax=Tengunoibacter tsumagoiensis TaxID=2014871 RepID=A0A401ZVH4_9CHLR|nr:chromate transporter [Tengunoibacter tsumagoiensis]GCE10893.1 hypothetical protein KTT_07520 [Tengunoibacter tsumagoiensis]